jgi:hypothetical protein
MVSDDPLKRLRCEVKDFTKIQPLALRGEITTWQYDAKNCIALHYRMIDGDVWSHELFRAIKKWATRLLTYADVLGFDSSYPAAICHGKPTVLQGYWYLSEELRRIVLLEWSDFGVQEFRLDTKVDICLLDTYPDIPQRCGLHHDALSRYDSAVRYQATVGGVRKVSAWIGNKSLRILTGKINRAVKRHRDSEYRNKLIKMMRSKKYGERKLRPGYRKA